MRSRAQAAEACAAEASKRPVDPNTLLDLNDLVRQGLAADLYLGPR